MAADLELLGCGGGGGGSGGSPARDEEGGESYEEESSERSSSPGSGMNGDCPARDRGRDVTIITITPVTGSASESSTSCSATGSTSGSITGSTSGEEAEPLSRMDSEDSISSTLMDVDSTISSGRSTPSMMNGLGLMSSSSKSISYMCCWDQCQSCFPSSPDLAEHIRTAHVDSQRGGVFVCFWKGCKVYNTPSTSQSWLQRHMLTHSGDKPFKCVVGGCTASFASQGGLARHVPTHFSQHNSSKMNGQKSKEDSPSKAAHRRRKLKNKRKRSMQLAAYMESIQARVARPHDFFDAQTLDAIRHRAICFNLSAQIESLGNGHSVVFHSTVIAKRKEESGKVKLLLHWTPEDILPDAWVSETERHQLKTKVVHLSKLPKDTALLLDPNIYRNPSKRLMNNGLLTEACS